MPQTSHFSTIGQPRRGDGGRLGGAGGAPYTKLRIDSGRGIKKSPAWLGGCGRRGCYQIWNPSALSQVSVVSWTWA